MPFRVNSQLVIDDSRNVVLGNPIQIPSAPVAGTIFFNQIKRNVQGWNGSSWVDITKFADYVSRIYTWGNNNVGQLGDNTTISKRSPVIIDAATLDWRQISAGYSHTVAIKGIGELTAWGQNNYGQLGDNSTTNRSVPVSVLGGFTDWVQMSPGKYSTLGLRANGTVWAWGRNNFGQLGDNSTTNRSSPVVVLGGIPNWAQISAGQYHNSAIRADGTAWAWGRNYQGQLGDNSTTNRSSPVSVVGGLTDWVQIDSGGKHTTAIRANGTAWGWGENNKGQLGDDTIISKLSPVAVVGGFTDWIQISAGGEHTSAIRANGTAWGWGRNYRGQLGDGTDQEDNNRSSPVSVVGGFTDWVQISAGGIHTSAIRANGTAWGWGRNNYGQLGHDSISNERSPVSVVEGFTDWVQISAGFNHSAAIR